MRDEHNIRPDWIKFNSQTDHFDPFQDIDIVQNDQIRHTRYGVNICQQNLLFGKTVLCEVTTKSTIYPIPNMPSWMSGMINLRGNIIPVFQIGEFLTDNKTTGAVSNLVFVIGKGNNAVGLLIHTLPITVEINEKKVCKIPLPPGTPEIFSECINTAYDIADEIWLEIDIHKVLGNINCEK